MISFLTKKREKDFYFVLISIFFLSIIVCFQLFGFSNDYGGYEKIFTTKENVEPFWRLIRFISNNIGHRWHILILVTTIISLFFKTLFFEKCGSKNYVSIYLFLYFLTFFWLHEYTQFRTSFAIGLSLLIYPFIKRKQIYYFFLTLIIINVHYSGVILIPLFFYLRFSKKKNFYILFPTICFFLLIILQSTFRSINIIEILVKKYLPNTYQGGLANKICLYKQSNLTLSLFNKFYLIFLGILYFTYFVSIRNRKIINKYFYYSYQSLSYGLSTFYLLLLTPYAVITIRMSEFFLPFSIVLLVCNIQNIKEKKMYLILVSIVVCAISIKLLSATGRL